MRCLHRTALAAVFVSACIGISAPSAGAFGAIEIKDDLTGSHCPTLPNKGCLVHIRGSSEMKAHFMGFAIHHYRCTTEIVFRFDEDGNGEVMTLDNETPLGDANCPTVTLPCDTPWDAYAEEMNEDVVEIDITEVCLDSAESDTNCTGSFQLLLDTSSEDALTAATTSSQNLGQCELAFSGSVEFSNWQLYKDIHVSHL
jgi:hypothetical protein